MPRAGTYGGSSPTWLKTVTRVSLVLGVVALAITVYAVGLDTLRGHLTAIGPWFAVLLVIEASATMCEAGAVYMLTRGPRAPSWRRVYVAQFAGRAVNSVTPGANVGEALKVSLLARECPTQRAIAAIMFVGLGAFVVSMSIVAIGSLVTAVMFPLPAVAVIALVTTGAVSGIVATSTVILVRRGMLSSIAGLAQRLHLISAARRERWSLKLEDLDARLRGGRPEDHRVAAAGLVLLSQILSRLTVAITIVATGYSIGGPQLIAILSAGVVLGWLSNVVPMGIGVAEGSNVALFSIIGAPPALGVALALAKRVNQIVFAALGFGVLAADRAADRIAKEVDDASHAVVAAP